MKLVLIFAFLATNSLSGQSVDSFLDSVTNLPPDKVLCRFLDYPPSRGTLGFPRCLFENPFPLNPDFYLKGIDFSCVSPWNDSYGVERAGTAISKRHIVCAKHFPLTKGTRIAFVGQQGKVSYYYIEAIRVFKNCDIMIALLDEELAPDIRPAYILPENCASCLPDGSRFPRVTFNKREQATMDEVVISNDKTTHLTHIRPQHIGREEWEAFRTRAVRGDSGNPVFMLYKRHPILLYCLHTGGLGYGPRLHEHQQEIQQAMDDLCPGYKLQIFDFATNK